MTKMPPMFKPQWGITLLLVAFILLATTYSLLIPLGESPDEVSHYSYIDALIQTHQLPKAEGSVLGESHQPPLYYALGALATFWIPRAPLTIIANPNFTLNDPATPNLLLHPRSETFPFQGQALAWHMVRLLSVLMGAVTVWATWKTMMVLLNHNAVALGAAAFVAFLPEFTFISAVINNDNLITMLAALTVLQCVRVLKGAQRLRDMVLLGVLLGAAALAKLSGLTLWLFAAFLFLQLFWIAPDRRKIILNGIITVGIAFLLAGPLFLYNQITHGDPLAWALIMRVTPVRTEPMTLDTWGKLVAGLYTSFFGRYGGALQLNLAPWLYAVLTAIALVALCGWILHLRDALRHQVDPNIRLLFILFVLFWGLMLAAYVRWTLAVLGTDQARQLFPGITLLAGVLAVGWARMCKRNETVGMRVWSGAWFVASLSLLVLILTTFIVQPLPATALAAPDSSKAISFGNQLQLVNYQLSPTTLHPGDTLTLDATWQATNPPRDDYWFSLRIMAKGEGIAHQDAVPGGGRVTTDRWQQGDAYQATHSLVIPPDADPGKYQVVIGIHPFGQDQWLKSGGKDTVPLGTITITPQ